MEGKGGGQDADAAASMAPGCAICDGREWKNKNSDPLCRISHAFVTHLLFVFGQGTGQVGFFFAVRRIPKVQDPSLCVPSICI